MKTTMLIAALAAGMAVTSAEAQERFGPRGMEMEFSALDANGDGVLTAEDMEALRAARFAEADTDGDGALSEAELFARASAEAEARMQERAAGMIARLDANEDGLLQPDEMTGGPDRGVERMLARFDTDGDGALSEAEFEAARAEMADHRGPGKGHGEGRRHGGDHGPRDRG